MTRSLSEAAGATIRPEPAGMTMQRQAQDDRDACDRLLKAIFDRGLGQRQIARVTGIPLSTVQRALQRVIYPYRQDSPIEDAPTWKKRRAKLESLDIAGFDLTLRIQNAGSHTIARRKSRATRLARCRVTPKRDEGDPAVESPALPGHALEGGHSQPAAVAKATENKLKVARGTAKLVTHPGVNAAMVIKEFAEVFGGLDAGEVAALAAHLKDGMNNISNNDLSGCEAMLYSQAHALQAIFVDTVLQVPKQGWFSTSEAYMRMGLKAQNQCRMTIETLATIKNPPVVFARQANIAQGPQQVNNGMMPAGEPRVGGKTKIRQTNYQGQQ